MVRGDPPIFGLLTNARAGLGFVLSAGAEFPLPGQRESKDEKMDTVDILLIVLGLALVGLLIIKFKGG